jgi:hypothetical protein
MLKYFRQTHLVEGAAGAGDLAILPGAGGEVKCKEHQYTKQNPRPPIIGEGIE